MPAGFSDEEYEVLQYLRAAWAKYLALEDRRPVGDSQFDHAMRESIGVILQRPTLGTEQNEQERRVVYEHYMTPLRTDD